jgi:hypothetical protein
MCGRIVAMNPSAEDTLRRAKGQLERAGHPEPACSQGALETIQKTWPEEFGYDFPLEYADLVRIVNGGLESDEFQLAYVPDPESEVDQLRRNAHREDLMQLNRRMRDNHGNEMRRKLFFFGSGAEAYYALDLERRGVLELDATFIDDEPLASWDSLDQFIMEFI